MAWTFRPLWHTCGSFHVSDAGQNYVVFAFYLEAEVEKVLMGEPWSFDRHLMVFQQYNGSNLVQELNFERVFF